jgi:hypothetical protein
MDKAMFEWINKQGVRSDKGFVVQRTGRWSIEYREGNRVLIFGVDGESLATDESGRTIQTIRINPFPRWEPPDEFITEERRQEIIENLKEAIIFEKMVPKFV